MDASYGGFGQGLCRARSEGHHSSRRERGAFGTIARSISALVRGNRPPCLTAIGRRNDCGLTLPIRKDRLRMSEYQYYEFQAIDRPLDRAAQEELRSISSRARITATSCTNH